MADYEEEHATEAVAASILGAHAKPSKVKALASQLRQRGRSPATLAGSQLVGLEDVKQEMLTEDDYTWSGYVAAVSAFDIVSSSVVIILAFVFAYRVHGISFVCLGLQVIAHLISSSLLAVRFVAERRLRQRAVAMKKQEKDANEGKEVDEGSAEVDEEILSLLKKQRRTFLGREQTLHMTMGYTMLFSSVALALQAYRKLTKWKTWYEDPEMIDREAQVAMEGLAWYGFAVYFLQAIFRVVAAVRMRRDILWQAFSASIVTMLFLFILGFGASSHKEWTWKAEPFAAIVLSMGTLIEGMRLLIFFGEDVDMRISFDPRA